MTRSSRHLRWVRLGVLPWVLIMAGTLACKTAPVTGHERFNIDIDSHLAKVGLGPGDVFEVRVYNEKQLSGVHGVAEDGTIDFPLIGRVHLTDKTPSEIAALLQDRLRNGYLREPYVSVIVRQYNSKKIFVLGEVHKPGTFPYRSRMSVVEAITLAGGFGGAANTNYVVVTRRKGDKKVRIPVPVEKISRGEAQNLILQAGDIVFVPDRLL